MCHCTPNKRTPFCDSCRPKYKDEGGTWERPAGPVTKRPGMAFVAEIPGIKPFGAWLKERYDLDHTQGITAEAYHRAIGEGFIQWVQEELTGRGPISLCDFKGTLYAAAAGGVYRLVKDADGKEHFEPVIFTCPAEGIGLGIE